MLVTTPQAEYKKGWEEASGLQIQKTNPEWVKANQIRFPQQGGFQHNPML